ncbi:MAG: V-type ATP synthase subunit F [Candidatus Omnitrophota bacterium]
MLKEDISGKTLAIIGAPDLVLGFGALGFQVYAADNKEGTEAALLDSVQKGSAVCLVQEELYRLARERINSFRDLPFPVFIPLSSKDKSAVLEEMVKDIRLRATGKF